MPNLTSKELTALGDQLNYEQILVAKYRSMANSCTDPAMKGRLENIANAHLHHFNTMKSFLN